MLYSKKKLCELVYGDIYQSATFGYDEYVLVFQDGLYLYKNNHKTSIIWAGNEVSFVFYRNDVLCYEFAGGLYAMKSFEEPVFLQWISEF